MNTVICAQEVIEISQEIIQTNLVKVELNLVKQAEVEADVTKAFKIAMKSKISIRVARHPY